MAYAVKQHILGDKMAQHCWGCGIFASCEPLQWTDKKRVMLCGNCMKFIEERADLLLKYEINRLKLRRILKWFRRNKNELNTVEKKMEFIKLFE